MAQKVNITLVDDIDGSEASETINFGLDGAAYEIDLNEGNASALRDALSAYVGHARRISGTTRRTSRKSASTASGKSNTKDVRSWAQQHGMEISERGRIPAEVQRAYDAAH